MNNDNFWTDELVSEFYNWRVSTGTGIYFDPINEFKKSKEVTVLPEKIEVKSFLFVGDDKNNDYRYEITFNRMLTMQDKAASKFESVLNSKEEDKCVFDVDKIYDRIKHLNEMEECFNAARLTHPMVGFKFDTFQDYSKSKMPEWVSKLWEQHQALHAHEDNPQPTQADNKEQQCILELEQKAFYAGGDIDWSKGKGHPRYKTFSDYKKHNP